MKIWLGDLGKYNEGKLIGEWIDLEAVSSDELGELVNKYSNNGQGDYFIADWCSDIEGLKVSEHSDPFKLLESQEAWSKLHDYEQRAVSFLLSEGYSFDDAMEKHEDVMQWEGNLEDVAHELVDEGCFGDIPKSIANYIDYEAIARDLSFDGYSEHDGYVFLNNN
jgi:antirestriction protein